MERRTKIKMRINKEEVCTCNSCGAKPDESLEMFDVAIGSFMIVVCDNCMNVLFQKTLKATCLVNAKVKTKRDLKIIKQRKREREGEVEMNGAHLSINEALKDVVIEEDQND